ncbi:hypothetical protein DICPUDRAFT_91999 [Dictyostelium purpureum]|uniref:Uncharacterized protein n=1 Tax=Dictyostelium purpureum TaxID=5786 RepID=F0ZKD7_DICPU|nr:uncharacterized protein DICPUDRAFT_91999 [Dictyostelium purpureum]EGC35574.1 hypothetical protein DICPUDRAFT_91999 [Dictyostelium purpureum]|eukprot:XP_003287877.1 hypothetical protein DICPUDRAFT_91999 [Dictyostelium purpureum]
MNKSLFVIFAIFALLGATFAKEESDITEIGQFLIGFADGMEITLNPNSQACLNGAENTLNEFVTGFQLIDSGFKSKSISQVGVGIQDLGIAIQSIPVVYQSCGITQFVSDIEDIAKELSSGADGVVEFILKEALEIWKNKHNLTDDFKTMIADWKSGDFADCGKELGTIVGVLISNV